VPENDHLTILFEDDDILLVSKPGGLATQAPRPFDSLEARIKSYLLGPDRAPYLGVPHRLDRCSSGVMVFAKRVMAARRLAKQFERREVTKLYLAIVNGNLVENRGTWRDHLRKIPDVARAEIVSESHPDARVAVLHYTVVTRKGSRCLLRIQLETGRMHQIRVQSASRGLPILGDETYGSNVSFGPAADEPRGRWIALHASELGFQHPRSRENLRHIATLPACWPAGDDT
jgi:23S rRNA pseudouridine1911/1915/1917 synthase